MSRSWLMSRRAALRGLGVTMALPMLEAMLPTRAMATTAEKALGTAAATGSGVTASGEPIRAAFIFSPNGFNPADFFPKKTGSDYDLPYTLEPLAKVKEHVSVLSGLAHNNARALGNGPGDHARSSAAFLTGAHPFKTNGKDIRLGVSVDQFAAQQIGERTRLPSLELGCDRGRLAGNCDSGYSCAYVTNIAWRSPTTPVPQEVDPASAFDRLFGSADARQAEAERRKQQLFRRSILDSVAGDAQSLRTNLGRNDQHKLDEYFTSIREIEQRIERAANSSAEAIDPGVERPDGIPRDYAEHLRLMYDMMVLAFQTDQTRIATFMVARAGSNRSFPQVGVNEGHHHLSHHRGNESMVAKIRKIDRFYLEQYAYFINRLASIREGEGTLLDNCMIVLGSGISDGNRHTHHDLPTLLAGRGGGAFTPGRHIKYERDTPLCNLFLSMLDPMGIQTKSFGDSTGRLANLSA